MSFNSVTIGELDVIFQLIPPSTDLIIGLLENAPKYTLYPLEDIPIISWLFSRGLETIFQDDVDEEYNWNPENLYLNKLL